VVMRHADWWVGLLAWSFLLVTTNLKCTVFELGHGSTGRGTDGRTEASLNAPHFGCGSIITLPAALRTATLSPLTFARHLKVHLFGWAAARLRTIYEFFMTRSTNPRIIIIIIIISLSTKFEDTIAICSWVTSSDICHRIPPRMRLQTLLMPYHVTYA